MLTKANPTVAASSSGRWRDWRRREGDARQTCKVSDTNDASLKMKQDGELGECREGDIPDQGTVDSRPPLWAQHTQRVGHVAGVQ